MNNLEHIILEKEDNIATITLNRPKVLNALNSGLFKELIQTMQELENDGEVRSIIITGAGDRAFSAGADVKSGFFVADKKLSGMKFLEISKPVIAAVNGMALGGGWEMAMACDLVIASEEATFGLTEVNLGVLPAGGGTQRLPRLIGKLKAKELLFTGERISASEAEKLGLVNKVVPPEELISEARDIAIKIAEKAPLAIKEIKSVVDRGLESNFDEGLGLEMKAAASLLSTKDAREGMLAFAQKRKPKFQGR